MMFNNGCRYCRVQECNVMNVKQYYSYFQVFLFMFEVALNHDHQRVAVTDPIVTPNPPTAKKVVSQGTTVSPPFASGIGLYEVDAVMKEY